MGKVINFHEVHNKEWIDRTILFLKKKYDIVSPEEFEEAYRNKGSLGNLCLLTVDDGASSFYSVIYPVLVKYRVPATIFVSPAIILQRKNFWFQEIDGYDDFLLRKTFVEVINKNPDFLYRKFRVENMLKCLSIDQIWSVINRYREKYNIGEKKCVNMSEHEIREVERSGLITIGAHTLRHPVLANEDDITSRNEIITSIEGLEAMLGHSISYFAYPNGLPGLDFGEREISILKETGCRMVFTTVSGNTDVRSDLINIRRYELTCGDSTAYIQARFCFGKRWNSVMKLKAGNEERSRNILRNFLTLNTKAI